MFWWRRSLACPDAGRTGGFSLSHRVQGRRRHKIAPQILFRCNAVQWRSLFEKEGIPTARGPSGSPPAWRNASSRSEIPACLALRLRFLVNFRFVSVKSCRCIVPSSQFRVAVILLLLQIVFTLQDIEFVSVIREFLSCVSKGFPPIRFVFDRGCLVVRRRNLTFIVRRRSLRLIVCRCVLVLSWSSWSCLRAGPASRQPR